MIEFNGIRIFKQGTQYGDEYEIGDIIEHPDYEGVFLKAEEKKIGTNGEPSIKTNVLINTIEKDKEEIMDELLEELHKDESDPVWKALLEYFNETI